MTTSVQQDELGTELQELYLKGKQWISELDFQHDETKFLKRHFAMHCPLLEKRTEFKEIAQIESDITAIEAEHLRLLQEIAEFMQFVSSLTKSIEPDIDSTLILWNSRIETELNTNLNTFRNFKQRVFKLTGE